MKNEASHKEDHPLHDFYQEIYQKYDLVNRLFTFGRDVSWRKKAVKACLQNKPEKVLDICTGTGDLILEVAKHTEEGTQLTGYDFSAEMLGLAREKADTKAFDIEFLEGDVASMPFESDTFDSAGISFGLRNLIYQNSKAEEHLAEINRVLKPGGILVILESSKPASRLWRFFNNIYLQFILPYLGGLVSGNLKAYKYLASSSKNYYSIEEMGKIMKKANFELISGKALFLGSVMLLTVKKQVK